LTALLEWVGEDDLPVIEDALWEGLATGLRSQVSGETEGLVDRQVGLDDEHWGAWGLRLLVDVTSSLVQYTINTTYCGLWALNFDGVDWLGDSWRSGQLASEEHSSSGWHDLTSTSMDSIGVESNIVNVESAASHVLVAKHTLFGGPLEAGNNGVLDLVQVLNSLGGVEHEVWTSHVWTEAPDLSGLVDVPTVFLAEVLASGLLLLLVVDLALLDLIGESVWEWLSLHEESVMLVWRLGQAHHAGLLGDGLSVADDWVGFLDWHASVVLLEILQADLQVELSSTGDNVLTGVSGLNDDHWIGLGKSFKTLDELWKIGWVLGLDGDSHDWADTELHDLHVVGLVVGGDGTGLDQVLVDADQTDDVTAWHVLDGLGVSAHHEDGSLDLLDVEIGLAAWHEVWSHDSASETGSHDTGEDSTEGVESALVGGWHHLGDVHHQWSLWVASLDTLGGLVVLWALIQQLHSVVLGGDWGWQVDGNHLKEGVTSWQPGSHESLHEWLTLEVLVVTLQLDTSRDGKLGNLLVLLVHDSVEHSVDWVHDELDEGSLFGAVLLALHPLLGLSVEVVVAPESLHELGSLDLELLAVHIGKLFQGEGPGMKTGTETNGTSGWVDLDITEWRVLISTTVSSDNNVDILNDSLELLVELLWAELEGQKRQVHLVHEKNWLNSLRNGLSEHGLGLHANTGHAIDNDESTVGDSKGGGNLGGEVDVAWGVDQVDQELVTVVVALEELHVAFIKLVEQGDSGGLDGNGSLLLVLSGVGESSLTSSGAGDDTRLGYQRVSQSRLTVVDVGDDGHVSDILLPVHDLTDLIDGKVHHGRMFRVFLVS